MHFVHITPQGGEQVRVMQQLAVIVPKMLPDGKRTTRLGQWAVLTHTGKNARISGSYVNRGFEHCEEKIQTMISERRMDRCGKWSCQIRQVDLPVEVLFAMVFRNDKVFVLGHLLEKCKDNEA